MRGDTKVVFVKEGGRVYNQNTGNYEISEPVKTSINGLVTDTGTERMGLLYGSIKQRAKTVRIKRLIDFEFDHIEINGEKYRVDQSKKYRRETTFFVSGV